MGKYRFVYCGSNEVPVHWIKPILDEIDAELVIERPRTDAEVAQGGSRGGRDDLAWCDPLHA